MNNDCLTVCGCLNIVKGGAQMIETIMFWSAITFTVSGFICILCAILGTL